MNIFEESMNAFKETTVNSPRQACVRSDQKRFVIICEKYQDKMQSPHLITPDKNGQVVVYGIHETKNGTMWCPLFPSIKVKQISFEYMSDLRNNGFGVFVKKIEEPTINEINIAEYVLCHFESKEYAGCSYLSLGKISQAGNMYILQPVVASLKEKQIFVTDLENKVLRGIINLYLSE